MIKILVTGASGQLGSEIQELAAAIVPEGTFHFTNSSQLDISDETAVNHLFNTYGFDFCINCAAYTAVDKAEEERGLADKINLLGAENLAKACKEHHTRLIHVSTDFVFDGSAHKPLKETDPTKPVNYYGASKLKGEQAIAAHLDDHFIIRTSWLYSTYGNNFVKTMLRLASVKEELNIIADQIGTPTYAQDLARSILYIITSDSHAYGIYHFSNEGVASWYDFTKAIFEYKNISTRVNPIPTEKYPTPASRPHFSVMDKTKFRETFAVGIAHWRESLRSCLEKLE